MKRKYLIVAMDMANLAAGIVFKRIVCAMSKYAECDVYCPVIDDAVKQQVRALPCRDYKRFRKEIDNRSFNRFGIRLSEYLWGRKAYKQLLPIVKNERYDAILSFIYGSNLSPLVIGQRIASNTQIPWAIYTVDAIPTPLAWIPNDKLYNTCLKFIRRYLSESDAVFAANPKMLRYELNLLPHYQGLSGVVLTPSEQKGKSINEKENSKNKDLVFLYAGQVYNIRRIGTLLKGFEMLLSHTPRVKLIFVGVSKLEDFAGYEKLLESGRIERYGFTKDIDVFYQDADILLDINGDVENDVFLSSKICNYLSYDKPIVTISRDGSPVREMMSGYKTIIHSHHDPIEIHSALVQAIDAIGYDYNERSYLCHSFEPNTVAKGFCSVLERIDASKKVN